MSEPKEVVVDPGTWRRPAQAGYVENEDVLRRLTTYGGELIVKAIESCYSTLDLIDSQLVLKASPPLSQLIELANLSSMLGNLLGAGLAEASLGGYLRNRPHTYPDLVPQREQLPPLEIKTALETNRPKGHLPKPGLHVTFRYVLGNREGAFTRGKENRGEVVWVWESRIGNLTEADYDLSNTEGDSGKTAVIKTESFKNMARIFYVPALLPYATRAAWYGDVAETLFAGPDLGES